MSDVPRRGRHVPQVLWIGRLDGASGYADEARGYLRVLEDAGRRPVSIELDPTAVKGELGEADLAMLRRQSQRPFAHGGVAVHHYPLSNLRALNVVAERANVQRTMFETDCVPREWVPYMLMRDEVWVPCEHNREAFERCGVPSSRLRVVPETIDFDLFSPDADPLPLPGAAGGLRFLSNFDFQPRKNWQALLAAWAHAFEPTDPVCLVLKALPLITTAQAIRERVALELERAARAAGRSATAPVHVITEVLSPEDVARLYAACDAYVLPSRGEAWGRPYMEALAMGLPTIAPAWSGHLDFMDPQTSWLVEGELVDVPAEESPYFEDVTGHRWFEVDRDALTGALRDIASDPDAARARVAPVREDLIARFGPDAMLELLDEAVLAVSEGRRDAIAGGRACAIRGEFGRTSSLAAVNDHLLRELAATGRQVHALATGNRGRLAAHPAISHSWPPDFDPAADGPSVVILPWEAGHPHLEWVDEIHAKVDRVVVPSDYVRDGLVEGGIAPGIVQVVPNGVDTDLFTPEGDAGELPVSAGCVFLFVGGTIYRKGPDLLLEAWTRAFGPDDDVLLVVKDFGTGSLYENQNIGHRFREAQARADVAPIHYLDEDLVPEALAALYRAADVLVAPYRGEGFCLPVLEAMACGRPAIHSAGGPTEEFCGEAEGWAVPARRVPVPPDFGLPELAGPGYVLEPDVDALAATLRAVAADAAERTRRGAAARERAAEFTWGAAAQRLEACLDELEAEALPLARHTHPAQLETRATSVLYAPEWADEATWAPVLRRWAETVPADADVSLVLQAPAEDAERLAARAFEVLTAAGYAEASLPDIVLEAQERPDVAPLVAAVDAVLLDDRQAAARPAALVRRARRVLLSDAHELRAFADEVSYLTQAAAA